MIDDDVVPWLEPPDLALDVTADVCPMTFVRVRLALDRMRPGQTLRVLSRGEEPRLNLSRAAQDVGVQVLSCVTGADGVTHLLLRR